jgi:hypothetical protein
MSHRQLTRAQLDKNNKRRREARARARRARELETVERIIKPGHAGPSPDPKPYESQQLEHCCIAQTLAGACNICPFGPRGKDWCEREDRGQYHECGGPFFNSKLPYQLHEGPEDRA